ncbi:MAG: PolC-type DNA polymerase III [Candidatus Firestonebacteria bacterium]|nr:PolC-type DNA polymerase III [Candidatus Firestonebacteria bacterium]
MRPDVSVKPEGFTPRLRSLIEALEIPDDAKKTLLNAQPQAILVSPGNGSVTIDLFSGELLSKAGLESVRAEVTKALGSPPNFHITWDVHYPEGRVSPFQYLTEHWSDVVDLLSRDVNMAGAYLSIARFRNGDGNRIRISVPNEMSLAALQRRQGEETLSRLLTERVGGEVSVRLEIGDCGEEVQKREALYQQRIHEELAKLQAESDEEAPAGGGSEGSPAAPRAVWRPIYGRKVASPPKPIIQITEEEDNVVIEGELITYECKTLRTGRLLVLMDVYDKTGTINARFFVDAGKHLPPELKQGSYARLRGTVQFDKFTQDLTLFMKDISLGDKPKRTDQAAEKRVELHAHTQISAMDALASVENLVAQAAAFGHPAIAITDHGVVQAFPEAAAAAVKHKIKVLFGMEGYLVEDNWGQDKSVRPYHISILIARPAGIKNMYRMVSEAHLKHYYRNPRIPRSLLAECREGLLLGTACENGELFRRMLEGATEAEMESIAQKYDYLEIMPRGNNGFLLRSGVLKSEEELLGMNQRIYALGRRLGKPVVATGDVHFLEPGDEVFRSILQSGMGYEDAALQAPLYLKTTDEMLAEFAYLGEDAAREVVVTAPQAVAESVDAIQPLKNTFHPPKLKNAESELQTMAQAQAKSQYGEPLPEAVVTRLDREIKAINGNNYASLFLIARKLVKKSLEDGYLVGSRGSVGSSLTATMLGITEVNPLPGHYLCPACHFFEIDTARRIGADLPDRECPTCRTLLTKDGFDIPFEVFMGFKGDKVPDIDLNFSGDYQSTMHKYVEELFDNKHIFKAGTISTVAERIAYGFVKKYLEEHKLVLREAEINRLTRGCSGVKKTTGQHPGGIMIVPEDLDVYDFTPIQHPADDKTSDIITTHFDYHAIHDSLVKLDILGHDDPTSLRRLGDLTGLDVRSLPLDDPETLKIFSSVETLGITAADIGTGLGTLGIPEFGTEFVRQMLEATKPTRFSELVRISGLSHGTDVWLNNAADLISNKTATLSSVISARDDIMNYLISKSMEPALSFKIMENVRKGKGVAEDQEAEMKKSQVPEWYIESCKKIKYMFPKAHAVAYCIMAFRIAYFKVHHPAAFYTNYFTLNAEAFDADLVVRGRQAVVAHLSELKARQDLTAKEKDEVVVLEVVREALARGIRFRPVALMESDARLFTLTGPSELLPPLCALAGLGATCADRIVAERPGRPFRSQEDLSRRTGANKNVIEILAQHGCLGVLPKTDQTTLF